MTEPTLGGQRGWPNPLRQEPWRPVDLTQALVRYSDACIRADSILYRNVEVTLDDFLVVFKSARDVPPLIADLREARGHSVSEESPERKAYKVEYERLRHLVRKYPDVAEYKEQFEDLKTNHNPNPRKKRK